MGVFGLEFLKSRLKISQSRLKMDRRAPSEGLYRFGPFRLDPAERVLTRDGAPIPLTYRVFETLLALVRNPGRLLTKDELMDFVWPGRIVDEGSLTQAIFTLRKALGGTGEEGRYIVTVPGRGYSFNAPVEAVASAASSATIREALSSGPLAGHEAADHVRLPKVAVRYLATLGLLAILAAGAAIVMLHRSPAPVPGKPIVVVVADFQNLSNNPLFDKTFTTATKMDLQQSPFLSVLPDHTVEDTLDLMTRPKDARLTPDLAVEVCARNNGQAAISGAIAQVGTKYLLTLTATDCVNKQVLSSDKAEVTSLDALLPALDRLAEGARQRLGESTVSIEKFSAPIIEQRTGSFEALRAYSEAYNDFTRGKYAESVPLFQRAVEIDPNFAAGYAGLSTVYANLHEHKLEIANITKAYTLRNNASEMERLFISMRYNVSVLGDMDETIRILKAWTDLYPNDASVWANLSNSETWIGEYAPSIADGRQAVALNQGMETAYVVLARAYLRTGQFDLASAICAQSVAKHLDGFDTHRLLLQLAFAHGDMAGVERQVEWASGKPAERFMLIEAGQVAFSQGQVHKALDLFARALELGKSLGLTNYMAAPDARWLYDLGMKDLAAQNLAQVPADYDSADYRYDLMEFGDEAKGETLLQADLAKSPSDTLLNEAYAPEARAAQALRHGQPAAAIAALLPSKSIEMRTLDIPYLRGEAYLAAHDGAGAAAVFRKILDNRGIDPVTPLYSLSYLGLARALRMEGNLPESRAAYEELFVLWKDADKDLAALQDAENEYAHLPAS
jgi:eukaryotic-like serine/threonine-protein kinase